MSKASRQLDADRAERNRARERFDSRLSQVKDDMTPASISSRIAGQIRRRSRKTLDEAVQIASGNRTVLAGTAAALAVWYLRKPILSWLGARLLTDSDAEDGNDDGN